MQHDDLGCVIVTGGAGFIGCALSELLASRARQWIAIDNLNPRIHDRPGRPSRLSPDAELIVADIRDPTTWDAVLNDMKPDIVIHLASETDTGLSLTNATRFSDVNVTGTAVMLDALMGREITPSHVLVASSRAIYGEGTWSDEDRGREFAPGARTHRQLAAGIWDFPHSRPLPSRAGWTMPNPTNIYGSTKLAQETLMSSWCGARDVRFTALRLQNVYGAGQSLINPYTGILPLFVQAASRGESINVFEDGLMSRDFVHVDDVARAFQAVIESDESGELRTYDVGSGVATPILAVARLISRMAEAPDPTVSGEFRDGDIRHASCTVEDIRSEHGWEPRIDWEAGISDYARWYRDDKARRS
jgi:dTDP-L-rhamnose 4-epimerase